MRELLYTVSLLCGILLTGCSSTSMTIGTVMSNQRYMSECMGVDSRHSWRDPVCQHMGEPVPANGMAQYRVNNGPRITDPRVRVWCQMRESGRKVPENITDELCGQLVN